MTAIEPQQDGTNPRKKLYSALVGNANPEAKSHFKKFSFEQFNKRLDDEKFVEDLYQSLRDNDVVLDPKNRQPEQNYYDFIDAYVKVPTAKPAAPVAKPAAAPVAAPVAAAPIEQAAPIPSVEPMEEEEIPEVEYEGQMLPEVTATPAPYQFPEPGTLAYEKISRSNPPIGSPEYDFKIAMLNQPPKLALGPGGYTQDMAASLPETMEKAKQSSLSPVFKDYEVAQKMMKGEVPLVTQKDVREAKEGFGRATKEQQQAAIMGGPGYEYEQERKAEERGFGEATGDLFGAIGAGGKRIATNILSGLAYAAQTGAATDPYANLPYEKRQEMMKGAGQAMYNVGEKVQKDFQNEIAKRNIQTSVYQAFKKGQYGRIPESTLYTIGDAAMQIIPSIATFGGSTYFQTLPQAYKDGVEAIAKEKRTSPEAVIQSGDDAIITAQISAGIQGALEQVGARQVSGAIASKGGYKAVRDWLLKNTNNKALARAGGLGFVSGAEGITEFFQEGVGQTGKLSAKSETAQAFFNKLPDELFSKEAKEQRQEALVGGLVAGLGLGGAGRAVTKAFEKGPDITQFSPEVQGNEIIQEAARGYQDNIAKAEEQGRKPDAFNKRELNKLATDPESWVKGEIKYLTQTIQDNKKNNIDSKVEETKLSRANALLAQIKAEKKGMEQAALASAQEAAPVAPEAEFVPAETVTAPEVVAPEAPVTETAPVTEEVPVAEEVIPVAPETEEDYSFLEETELTPEEEAALLAQEEAAPVAPAEEEVVAPQTREEIIRNNEKARQEYKKQRAEKREERLAKKQQLIDSGLSEDEATAILTKEIRDEEEAFEKSLPKVPELPKSQFQVDTEKNEADFEKMLQQTGAKKTNKAWGIAQLGDSFGYEIGDKNGAIYIKPYEEEIDTEEGRENVVTGTAIELVYVPPGQRGVGKAKKLIQQVVDAADKTGTTLKIEAVPQGEEVDVAGLKKLYESFGFVFDDIYGTRAPQAAPVEEAAPEAPAAPMKEVGVGGIIYGHEDIVGNKGLGDVRNQLPEENSGVIIANGKDGNQYAVAFSRKGGDRQNIFEQTPAARPGHIYTSVKIDDPSNAQEVEQAKKQAEAALAEILPTVKGGNIRASAVQQAIADFQTKKPAEPAPAPKAKKAPAPKAETKQEAPKTETKKEEAPKTEAKPVSEKETSKVLQELGKRQVPEGKGSWRARFNKETDPFKKKDILRGIADSSNDINELNDIKEAAKGMPDDGNILAVVDKKLSEKEEGKKPAPKEEKVMPTSEALKDIDSKGYESQAVGPYVIIAGNVFDASKTQGRKWEYSDGKLISIQEKNKVIVKPESVRLSQKEAARLAQAYSVVEQVDSEPFKPIINYIAAASGMSATELLETFGKGKPIPSSEYNLPFSDFEKSVRDILGKVKGLNDKISSAQIMEDYYLHHFGKAPSITKAENKLEASESIADFYGKPEATTSKKPSTKELASQVEDMRSLPPAKRKAAQQALEERYGKEDVEKMIEITANFTKIIDDLEQRGVVKIDCP